MASMTMSSSFLGSSVAAKLPNTTPLRNVFMVKAASKDSSSEGTENMLMIKNSSNGRREIMMAVAAAAACSIAKVALADDEPKRGTPEAKKKYAPVCVTNPTARICRY